MLRLSRVPRDAAAPLNVGIEMPGRHARARRQTAPEEIDGVACRAAFVGAHEGEHLLRRHQFPTGEADIVAACHRDIAAAHRVAIVRWRAGRDRAFAEIVGDVLGSLQIVGTEERFGFHLHEGLPCLVVLLLQGAEVLEKEPEPHARTGMGAKGADEAIIGFERQKLIENEEGRDGRPGAVAQLRIERCCQEAGHVVRVGRDLLERHDDVDCRRPFLHILKTEIRMCRGGPQTP